MKITDQMFLAYRTYMICKAIEDDMARHPNQKGITYMVRSGSSSEVGSFYDLQKEKEKAETDYSDWDAADWEGYFATIRNDKTKGKAAAEAELDRMNKAGLIPKNMIVYASIGARGSLGH